MVDNVYKAPDSELELPANQEARKRPLASRWSRLFASLIDSIVLMLVMVPLMFISGGMAGMMQVGDSLLYSLGMGISGIVIFLLINFNWLKKMARPSVRNCWESRLSAWMTSRLRLVITC